MKTIELSAALNNAAVKETLKNFVGVDETGNMGLMTPERLAAVAGDKMSFYSCRLESKLIADEVGLIPICEEIITIVPDNTMFSLLVNCGNALMFKGYVVGDRKYGFISVYSYNQHRGSFTILNGVVRKIGA